MTEMEHFVFTYTGKPIGESGESYGTKYNLDFACGACGTGAKVEGNLRADKLSQTERNIFQTLDGDYIISESLYNHILKENLQIGDLKKLEDIKGNPIPYFHLSAKIVLPKAQKTNGLIVEHQCVTCKRNGYFNDIIIGNLSKGIPTKVKTVDLVYDKLTSSLSENHDIFNSWEHMGISNKDPVGNKVVRYARPLLIVSKNLKKLIENLELKNLKFEQITSN